MKIFLFVLCVVFLVHFLFIVCSSSFLRGLSPSKLALYDLSKEFRCLDGSLSIPFSHVNDDYCDCVDGTDEPGTSACPNGSFYCRNPGYKSLIIPSSRINDGICDCCDGEDEYNSQTQCANLCIELGRQLKEEEKRLHKLKLEGFEIYKDYIRKSTEAQTTKQVRLEELQKERDAVDMERAVLEKRKNELEQPEKEARERYEKWWEEEKLKRKEEKKQLSVKEAFASLDINHDEKVSVEELTTHLEFDIDSNGEVSLEEAKEYLEENDAVTFDVFLGKIWENIHEIYRRPGDEAPAQRENELPSENILSETLSSEESDGDQDDGYGDGGNEDDFDEGRDDHDEIDEPKSTPNEKEVEERMPDYDENTKYLIEAAEQARREYNTVDSKYRNIENEINDIKKVLDQDLGAHGEFYPLMGQCFDFTDREYVYTLCPFDRTAQRGKSGGVETSLGRWGSWIGQSDAKYAVMKYDHGLNCWNGPDRSAKVHIQCGLNNELISVTEPNRCEYRFVFNTPAACNQPPEPFDPHVPHTEL